MASNKQRRAELDAKKHAKQSAAAAEVRAVERAALARLIATGVPVNRERLKPHNSYGEPTFVERGCYVDEPFVCDDCGQEEVWTATQQKWWYEVAGGDVFTKAHRCRPCRRRERERKAEARRVAGQE